MLTEKPAQVLSHSFRIRRTREKQFKLALERVPVPQRPNQIQ
jgi:hypothetical protein